MDVSLDRCSSVGCLSCEEECDLLYATRILNDHKWPAIKDFNSFKGLIVHMTTCSADYLHEGTLEKRSRCPHPFRLYETCNHTPNTWTFLSEQASGSYTAKTFGQNKKYLQGYCEESHENPRKLLAHAKDIEN